MSPGRREQEIERRPRPDSEVDVGTLPMPNAAWRGDRGCGHPRADGKGKTVDLRFAYGDHVARRALVRVPIADVLAHDVHEEEPVTDIDRRERDKTCGDEKRDAATHGGRDLIGSARAEPRLRSLACGNSPP